MWVGLSAGMDRSLLSEGHELAELAPNYCGGSIGSCCCFGANVQHLLSPAPIPSFLPACAHDQTCQSSNQPPLLRFSSGGKWTTYRNMAKDAIDAACESAGLAPARDCRTERVRLVGAAGYSPSLFTEIAQNYVVPHRPGAIDTRVAKHLTGKTGVLTLWATFSQKWSSNCFASPESWSSSFCRSGWHRVCGTFRSSVARSDA